MMEPVTSLTAYLSTWSPLLGPMSLTPMALSGRLVIGDDYLSKMSYFGKFLRFTFNLELLVAY